MIALHGDLEIRLAVAVDIGLHDVVCRDPDHPGPCALAVSAVIGGKGLGESVPVDEMKGLIAGL